MIDKTIGNSVIIRTEHYAVIALEFHGQFIALIPHAVGPIERRRDFGIDLLFGTFLQPGVIAPHGSVIQSHGYCRWSNNLFPVIDDVIGQLFTYVDRRFQLSVGRGQRQLFLSGAQGSGENTTHDPKKNFSLFIKKN